MGRSYCTDLVQILCTTDLVYRSCTDLVYKSCTEDLVCRSCTDLVYKSCTDLVCESCVQILCRSCVQILYTSWGGGAYSRRIIFDGWFPRDEAGSRGRHARDHGEGDGGLKDLEGRWRKDDEGRTMKGGRWSEGRWRKEDEGKEGRKMKGRKED